MSIKTDREFITKALSSNRYDDNFKELSFLLAKNSKNLPRVKADIENYPFSNIGKAHALGLETHKEIKSYSNPLKLTLTSRFEIDCEKMEKKYTSFINHISQKTLKNAFRRYGKTVPNIGYIEGFKGGDEKIHIHAIIDVPSHIEINEMKEISKNFWFKISGLITEMEVPHNGSAFYVAKMKSKKNQDVARARLQV